MSIIQDNQDIEATATPLETRLVVIQPSGFCNINCKYCYLPNRHKQQTLNDKILSNIFSAIFKSPYTAKELTIVWHCGEPFALPVEFYERAFFLIEKNNLRNIKVSNSFQTNGTLIDEKWCEFIKNHKAVVGVSLDGPKKYHDAYRIDRNGQGTFERTMRGISLLKQHEIDFHIISVLTKESICKPDELWDFFLSNRIKKIAFNVDEIDGVNMMSTLAGKESQLEVKAFFDRLIELRANCIYPIYIRELNSMENKIRTEKEQIISSESTPLSILSFDCEGNMSTFSPEFLTMTDSKYGTFSFGNVMVDSVQSIIKNYKFRNIYEEIQKGLKQCQWSCEYFEICGGGAPSNKLYENGSLNSSETMYCRNHIQAVADAVMDYLEKTILVSN